MIKVFKQIARLVYVGCWAILGVGAAVFAWASCYAALCL